MHAHNRPVAQHFHHAPNQFGIFVRHRKTHRIRQVHGARTGLHHRAAHLLQVVRIGARGIFRRKLHIVGVIARQRHRRHRFVQHLLTALAQLVSKMDIARRNERVNARPLGVLQRLRGAFHISRASSRESCHLHPGKLPANRVYRFKVAI